MIRKHVMQFGKQWDQYLPGLLWAYRNTPHESTGRFRRLRQDTRLSMNDCKTTPRSYRLGEWVLVRFPSDETGKQRKLSRPWHGPCRVLSTSGPDVMAQKVYFPEDGQIQIHQSRVCDCLPGFPAGYYWYGENQKGSGQPPKWFRNY